MTAKLRLRRPEPSEAQVLDAVLRRLAVDRRVVWAHRMNSGGGKLALPNGETSQFMRWGFPGCPDILGQLITGQLLAVEVKRPTGAVKPQQRAFLDLAWQHNAVAFIARRIEDVDEALDNAF